jgi:hypothetical protein
MAGSIGGDAMKRFYALLLLAVPVLAQGGFSVVVDHDEGIIDFGSIPTVYKGEQVSLSAYIQFKWKILRTYDGNPPMLVEKSFDFAVESCKYYYGYSGRGALLAQDTLQCKPVDQKKAERLAPVEPGLIKFESWESTRVPKTIHYGGKFAVVQPANPGNPRMIFFDGLLNAMILYDLKTFGIVGQVTVPSQARVFGVRPESNEVWVAHAGLVNEISMSDVGTQSMLGAIPTPSLDPNTNVPVGIVFTNSGLTALYAVSRFPADTAGNRGALLVYDVAGRKLTATLPLNFAPTAVLMAPDGLTAYVAGSGKVAYYDVLSGTAELIANMPYFGGGIFVSPDGTRLLFDQGRELGLFDLNMRTSSSFSYQLPATATAVSVHMAQDGSSVVVVDTQGNSTTIDARFGNVLSRAKSDVTAKEFPGPAVN